MKYVPFYESAPDAAATAPLHFSAHKEWHEALLAQS
jgi:hypothetical protein